MLLSFVSFKSHSSSDILTLSCDHNGRATGVEVWRFIWWSWVSLGRTAPQARRRAEEEKDPVCAPIRTEIRTPISDKNQELEDLPARFKSMVGRDFRFPVTDVCVQHAWNYPNVQKLILGHTLSLFTYLFWIQIKPSRVHCVIYLLHHRRLNRTHCLRGDQMPIVDQNCDLHYLLFDLNEKKPNIWNLVLVILVVLCIEASSQNPGTYQMVNWVYRHTPNLQQPLARNLKLRQFVIWGSELLSWVSEVSEDFA